MRKIINKGLEMVTDPQQKEIANHVLNAFAVNQSSVRDIAGKMHSHYSKKDNVTREHIVQALLNDVYQKSMEGKWSQQKIDRIVASLNSDLDRDLYTNNRDTTLSNVDRYLDELFERLVDRSPAPAGTNPPATTTNPGNPPAPQGNTSPAPTGSNPPAPANPNQPAQPGETKPTEPEKKPEETKPTEPEKKPEEKKPSDPDDDEDWENDEDMHASAEQIQRALASMLKNAVPEQGGKKPEESKKPTADNTHLIPGEMNPSTDEDGDDEGMVIPGIGKISFEEMIKLHDALIKESGYDVDPDYDYDEEASIPGEYDGVRAKKLRNK